MTIGPSLVSHVTISASGFSSHSFFEQFDDGVAGGPIGEAGMRDSVLYQIVTPAMLIVPYSHQ